MQDAATQVYSARLGAISPAQFQAALDRFGLGRFVGATPITAGNFGQNVYVTSTTGAYVLRGAPYWPEQLPAERFFTDRLHAATTAPVPWPYRLDPTEDIFGWNYVIMPRMPGIHPHDAETRAGLSLDDRLGIARAMGETLARVQGARWPCAGVYDMATDTIRPRDATWDAWIAAEIRGAVEIARSVTTVTTEDDVRWVEAVIAETHAALTVPFTPTFVATDYKEDNAVVMQGAEGWRVTGIFDYQDAFVGDGELDLVRSVGDYWEEDPGLALARAFVGAYRARCPLRPGFAARFRLYMLYDRTRVWQFGHRNQIWWDPGLSLRAWAEPYVELDVFAE